MHYLLLQQKTLSTQNFNLFQLKKILSLMLVMIPNAVERFKVRKHNFSSLRAEKAERLASLLTQTIFLSGKSLRSCLCLNFGVAFHYFSLFVFIYLFDIYFWKPTMYQMLGTPHWPKPGEVTSIREHVITKKESHNRTPQSSMCNCYKGDGGQTHNWGGQGGLWEAVMLCGNKTFEDCSRQKESRPVQSLSLEGARWPQGTRRVPMCG